MGRRLKEKDNHQKNCESEDETEVNVSIPNGNSPLSLKDAGVILTMAFVLSIVLVTSTIGLNGVVERFQQNDILDIITIIFFSLCLFALLSYMLVKLAAHYVVYLAVATFCGIVFPVSRRKQRETIREIYEKAKR